MRQRLSTTDDFYHIAIGKLLELCTNSINDQKIIQLAGHLYLTVDNGDTFELVINEVEDMKANDETAKDINPEASKSSVAVGCNDDDYLAKNVDCDKHSDDITVSLKSAFQSENKCLGREKFHPMQTNYCFTKFARQQKFFKSSPSRNSRKNRDEATIFCRAHKILSTGTNSDNSLLAVKRKFGELVTENGTAVVANSLVAKCSYLCSQCDKNFISIDSLLRHEVSVHERDVSSEEKSEKQRSDNSYVVSDMAEVASMPVSVATKVEEPSELISTSGSQGTCNRQPYKHRLCKKWSFHNKNLSQQQNDVLLPVQHIKGEPNVSVPESDQFSVYEPHRPIVRYKYICQLCGKVFPSADEVRRHESNVHGHVLSIDSDVRRLVDDCVQLTAPKLRRNYACQPCGKVFQTSWGLSRHNVALHGKVLGKRNRHWRPTASGETLELDRSEERPKETGVSDNSNQVNDCLNGSLDHRDVPINSSLLNRYSHVLRVLPSKSEFQRKETKQGFSMRCETGVSRDGSALSDTGSHETSERQTEVQAGVEDVSNYSEDISTQQSSVMSYECEGSETNNNNRHATLAASILVKEEPGESDTASASIEHASQQAVRSLYVCQLCGKLFRYANGVRVHEMNVHGRVLSMGRAVKRVVDTSVQSEYCVPMMKYECKPCHKVFMRKWGLRRHEASAHGKELKKRQRNWYPIASDQMLPPSQSALDPSVNIVRTPNSGSNEGALPVEQSVAGTYPLVPGRYRYMRGFVPTKWGLSRFDANQRQRIKVSWTSLNRLLGNGKRLTSRTEVSKRSEEFQPERQQIIQVSKESEKKNTRVTSTQILYDTSNNASQRHTETECDELNISDQPNANNASGQNAWQQTVRSKYACHFCGKLYAFAHGVRKHEKNLHGRVLSYGRAVKRVVDNSMVQTGSYVPAVETFACPACPKVFKYKNGLVRHQVSAHGRERKKRKCNPIAPDHLSRLEKSALDAGTGEASNSRVWYTPAPLTTSSPSKTREHEQYLSSDGQQSNEDTQRESNNDIELFATASFMSNKQDVILDASYMIRSKNTRSIEPSKGSVGPFKCLDCPGSEFGTYDLVSSHRRDYHRRNDCNRCGVTFIGRQAFLEHARLAHPGVPVYKINMNFVCEFCSEIFACERFLTDHIATVHHGVQHQCDHCGKMLGSALTLSIHIRDTHTYEKSKTCDACGEQFPRLSSFIDHLHSNHPELLPEKYRSRYDNKCDLCGMKFSRRGTLLRHRESIHGDSSVVYRCTLCGRTYSCQRYLRRHQRNCAKRTKTRTPVSNDVETTEVTDVDCLDFVDGS